MKSEVKSQKFQIRYSIITNQKYRSSTFTPRFSPLALSPIILFLKPGNISDILTQNPGFYNSSHNLT